MSGAEYECKSCGRVFTSEAYSKSVFCPNCGMHLWPKYVKDSRSLMTSTGKKVKEIEAVQLTRDQINMDTLFEQFLKLDDFSCGEGVIFDDVPSWILARKKAYADFGERLSRDKLVDWEKLYGDFHDFLYFKNNYSWTTLYRSGLFALSDLKRLWKLLTFLQDESIDIKIRVREGIVGQYHCQGIGQNIFTALLHTFFTEKYGVWNSRTTDTLSIIRRTPRLTNNLGYNYVQINNELLQLAKELATDLTTVDSFMWFISKKIQIIQ